MPRLEECLFRLPQELRDCILELTCQVEPSRIDVNRDYLPPLTLQVNSKTRYKAAAEYYNKSSFYFDDIRTCVKWIETLDSKHVLQLRDVRCEPISKGRMLDLFNYEMNGVRS